MRKNKKYKGSIRTIVGTDTRINGDIWFVGDALIDGYVRGNLKAAGDDGRNALTISEHGCVKGSVVVPHLLLNGIVHGQVYATERVQLGPKARVIGNVQYKLLEMAIGAQVSGRLIQESEARVGQKDTKAVTQMEPARTPLVDPPGQEYADQVVQRRGRYGKPTR